MVSIKLFSVLRDKVGTDLIECDFVPGESTNYYLRKISSQNEVLKSYLPYMRVAINSRYVSRQSIVNNGDTLAIITPVSGG